MADYKLVDAEQLDAGLKTVADAIREKGGTTEDLEFPNGMSEAVRAIQSSGSDDFVGIKYSDFTGARGVPKIADARSLPVDGYYNNQIFGGYPYLFGNAGTNDYNGWNVGLTTIYINENTKEFSTQMFNNCKSLKNLYGTENVEIIQSNAFANCLSLTEFPYMPNVKQMETRAFYNCKNMPIAKFYNTDVSRFSADSLGNCTGLLDIYVPWAEGEVANAPWGAVNATIHYNTTYDENHNPIV